MGFLHQQKAVRDRTMDAGPSDNVAEPFLVLAKAIERLEARLIAITDGLARLEVRIAKLEARDAGDASPVTRDTTRDAALCHAHAERQRRYRERKKAPSGT